MKIYHRAGKAQLHPCSRAVRCRVSRPTSLGLLADLLSQRSALLDHIRKYDGVQDARIGDIASVKWELQHVQAQIDAVNNGEVSSSESPDSALEASIGQLARKAISATDQEHVTITYGQAVSGTHTACWGAAVAPYSSGGRKRLQLSFAVALPEKPSFAAAAQPALIWGVAPDGTSAWHEPAPGWSTEPPVSWDIAHGAWGTESVELGRVPAVQGELPVHGVVLDLPWKASMRTHSGIAFKWTVKSGREKIWFGDAAGGNLSVRASFAKFILSSTDSNKGAEGYESDDSVPAMNTSDKEDPSADASLLVGLSAGQLAALRATRSDGPQPLPQVHVAHDFANELGSQEHDARRSLMHRYNIAAQYVHRIQWPSGHEVQQSVDKQALESLIEGPKQASEHPAALHGLLEQAAGAEGQLMAVAVWLRLAAARLLVWNHNYNVKPREISTAQAEVTAAVADIWRSCPWARKTAAMVLGTVGRGGDGNQGQRIRDEILSIQSRNGCKGGMMEQWHQKLHNNTSPDDVEICHALIAYLESGLDIQQYWGTLHAAGIDQQRLASFDRSITQEPSFSKQQAPQLVKDLRAYLVTLSAVHGGLDLQSAALPVLGYSQVKRKGRSVHVEPVAGVNTDRLRKLVQALMALQQQADGNPGIGKAAEDMGPDEKLQLAVQKMELAMEARGLCADYLTATEHQGERARDVLHLDIILTGTVRTIIEANMQFWLAFLKQSFSSTGAVAGGDALLLLQMCRHATANYASLAPDNEHAVACVKELQQAASLLQGCNTDAPERLVAWALQVLLANAQKLGKVITYDSSRTLEQLDATCSKLAHALQVDQAAAKVAVEDAVRAMPHAPLAQLLAPLEQTLQKLLGGSMWRIVSPMPAGAVVGRVRFEQSLAAVQDLVLQEPTIIIAEQVGGDEDLPQGAVALLCMQNIDVLCHAALRARATGAFLACCLDRDLLPALRDRFGGQQVRLTMDGQDVEMAEAQGGEASMPLPADSAPGDAAHALTAPPLDCHEWVLAQGAAEEHVGSKCNNLWQLAEKMTRWVPVPATLGLPYSAWQRVLALPDNHSIAGRLRSGTVTGREAEDVVQQVAIPEDLHVACADAIKRLSEDEVASSGAAIHAIKRVWASSYGERAARACALLNVPRSAVHMSVVLQPLINASMAFVSHTQDPRQLQASGAAAAGVAHTHMYVEAVAGLGESLVGNVSGQPLSFTVDSEAMLKALRAAVQAGRVPAADLKCLGAASGQPAGGPQHEPQNLRAWLSELPASDFESAASCVKVLTAPSKSWMVVPGTEGRGAPHGGTGSSAALHYSIIARSASNMEDLQSYSGAGVFDSFPTEGSVYCVADCAGMWEEGLPALELKMLMMALASLEVKACLADGEMDVEGVLDVLGDVHVVQARPQV